MKQLIKRGAQAVGTGLALAAGNVMAAVPAGVETELTGAKTDVTTIGVAVFAVVVAIIIFKWFRKAL